MHHQYDGYDLTSNDNILIDTEKLACKSNTFSPWRNNICLPRSASKKSEKVKHYHIDIDAPVREKKDPTIVVEGFLERPGEKGKIYKSSKFITFHGWFHISPGIKNIFIRINNKYNFPAIYGFPRPDIYMAIQKGFYSGFQVKVPTSIFLKKTVDIKFYSDMGNYHLLLGSYKRNVYATK